jgi:small subunit ribosomal protein S16
MVKLRFKRVGRPHDPYFRLVAIDRRAARDAKPIEVLGAFNPRKVKNPDAVNVERIRYWVSVGAQASPSVVHALKAAGVWAQVKPGAAAVASATKSQS